MTDLLVKCFIRDYQNTDDAAVREKYGFLSSVVGIACNVILFAVKLFMGILSNSISIMSDAFNNLSDSVSCIVTMFGYKLAAMPADKNHPFGHGRFEYLTSLVLAVVIMIVGYELFQNSLEKVLHPEQVRFSWVVLVCLLASILVKIWMSAFNRKLGKKIDSSVMLATAQDSLNDVISTVATVISLVLSTMVSWPVDGIIGILVSVFVLYSGFEIIKDTISQLLGQPADKELVQNIAHIMRQRPQILGVHDMIIHSYGPGNMIGSAHAEVSADSDILKIHDIIDQVEKEIEEKTHVMFTIHMDPIETDNQEIEHMKQKMKGILSHIDKSLTFHDFRMVSGDTHTNLIFDIVVPFECKLTTEQIQKQVDEELSTLDQTYYAVITFDHNYTEM